MSVSSFLTRDGWRSKWILWGESISITQLLYDCTSIFGIQVVFTHCRWFCAETFGTTCSLGYPCLWFLQKLRQQVFNQEGFFANLNAEASTCKIFVNFLVFLRKSYHLRIVYPHIFSLHERLCRILLILSWCFHKVPWWSILTILIAYKRVGKKHFFLQNMDVRVGEEPASNSFTNYKPGSTPSIRNVDSDLRKWCLTDVTRSK